VLVGWSGGLVLLWMQCGCDAGGLSGQRARFCWRGSCSSCSPCTNDPVIVGWGGALHVAVEACRAFGSVTVASIRCWWAAGVLCMMLLERAVQLVLFLYQVNVDGAGGLAGCST